MHHLSMLTKFSDSRIRFGEDLKSLHPRGNASLSMEMLENR